MYGFSTLKSRFFFLKWVSQSLKIMGPLKMPVFLGLCFREKIHHLLRTLYHLESRWYKRPCIALSLPLTNRQLLGVASHLLLPQPWWCSFPSYQNNHQEEGVPLHGKVQTPPFAPNHTWLHNLGKSEVCQLGISIGTFFRPKESTKEDFYRFFWGVESGKGDVKNGRFMIFMCVL